MTKPFAYQIKVRLLSNGNKTWECCVTSDDSTPAEILANSDFVVSELEKRYPVLATLPA